MLKKDTLINSILWEKKEDKWKKGFNDIVRGQNPKEKYCVR